MSLSHAIGMQPFSLLAVLLFAYSTTLISAIPASYPAIHNRDLPACANHPARIAGTIFGRALEPSTSSPSPSPHFPRARSDYSGVIWCLPHTTTYIRITFLKLVTSPQMVELLLNEAVGAIQDHFARFGARARFVPIRDSHWQFTLNHLTVYAMTNQDQPMTWEVLRLALGVLEDFMEKNQFGTGLVKVFDRSRIVGSLVIGTT